MLLIVGASASADDSAAADVVAADVAGVAVPDDVFDEQPAAPARASSKAADTMIFFIEWCTFRVGRVPLGANPTIGMFRTATLRWVGIADGARVQSSPVAEPS
ncbi:hypothetical protein GCM10027169_28420 [Gordonia jinhuaensis]|uniref:Uncharacterized protein n=1 Tax=Gordonia jinhuaensis TaxID=1517702 RepID=A0A916T8Z0_9ACTN|nr:hypothetical protein GCM10011489_25380 [Gordonia jinhuaensis]